MDFVFLDAGACLPSDAQQRTAFVKLFRHVTIYIIEDWPALPTLAWG